MIQFIDSQLDNISLSFPFDTMDNTRVYEYEGSNLLTTDLIYSYTASMPTYYHSPPYISSHNSVIESIIFFFFQYSKSLVNTNLNLIRYYAN